MSKAVAADAARRPADRGVPVGLNEAALDSPTFRALAAHFMEQVDAIDKWLNGYVASTSKLAHDMLALEETVNTYLVKTMPPTTDGVIENDYALLALRLVAEGQRECWTQTLSNFKKMDAVVVEPIRSFLSGDMRSFKEARRALESSQRAYDTTLARYVSQSKTKEASALREDAFSVWESRKAYIQASMDFCQLAPQLRYTLDMLLVKVCGEVWREMTQSRNSWASATRCVREMDRVRGWSKEMELTEAFFKRELQMARRKLGETALEELKPSRELEDYSTSTVPFLGSRGPLDMGSKSGNAHISEKQGWLFLRMMSGKPVRYSWVRRWYYCRGGVFGWLVQGPNGVLQGDEIGVLLCNAKPAVGEERRFCFEVKTKNHNMMLQAETQRELTEWLQVFEVNKKEAFEASEGHLPGTADPAFSISPPSAPEFSAKALDSHFGTQEDVGPGIERAMTLAPGSDPMSATRQSFDVNGSVGRRSFTALGRDLAMREDGESSRDHAARIIQKLDLHRKSNSSTAIDSGFAAAGAGGSAGGIASLISASHRALPVQPPHLASNSAPRSAASAMPPLSLAHGSLAPPTLVKPPASTNLSRAAVVVAGERGTVSSPQNLPTSLVANYWGSNVWTSFKGPNKGPEGAGQQGADDDMRGTALIDPNKQASDTSALPADYPQELRAQSAQFRLLFPDAHPSERLVLVFRAAWSISVEASPSSEALAGDGRVYVTPDKMYFYSQQMGMVSAYSIHLDIITEVTSAAGKDCDFIFLHLGQGGANWAGYSRISIKIFLDDLRLLHARLNLMVDNLQAEEPLNTADMISALVSAERYDDEKRPSPSVESWEELTPYTPIDDGMLSGRGIGSQQDRCLQNHNRNHHRHIHPGLHHGERRGQSRTSTAAQAKGPQKLHLPAQPVEYEPEGVTELAAERHFEMSAKACFHVLFGDKSFVFPKLYLEHRARQIAQGPWEPVEGGGMRREFSYRVDNKDLLGRTTTAVITDVQSIDVLSDHVTYVVAHHRTAWHLPRSQSFKLVTKIVITYVARAKCKLAIYTGIEWSKVPALWKNLVERQALRDAANAAEELAEMATDQVRKLGPRRRTNRAIQVYGHVGQQTEVAIFSPAAAAVEGESNRKQAIKPRTLTEMALETARSFAESAVSSIIMWIVAGLQKLLEVASAQRVTLGLLGLSMVANVVLTSAETSSWWRERKATGYMRRIGVGPNVVMSKAIYMADLDQAVGSSGSGSIGPLMRTGRENNNNNNNSQDNKNSTCMAAYRDLVKATDMDAAWEEAGARLSWPSSRATARRLRRTRQRLASYRHELMVAMRVVNGVEREMVQSEWENWLINEKSLCDELDSLATGNSSGDKDADASKSPSSPSSSSSSSMGATSWSQKVLSRLGPGGDEALAQIRREHCGSCRRDFAEMLEQRMSSRL